MELTVLVKFEPVTNYIGNEKQQAVIVRGNTENDYYHAAHQRCMNICSEIRRDNCGDPSYTWIREFWDKDVPVDLFDVDEDDEDEDVDWYEDVDNDVKDVIPFLGDDDYIFDDGSNPFEDNDNNYL